jgi:hypothetical protein
VQEKSWPVRKAVAALTSRVAKLSVPDGKWPELIPFLLQLVSNKDEESLRIVGMLLFRAMGENLGRSPERRQKSPNLLWWFKFKQIFFSIGQHMLQSLGAFASVVEKGLKDPSLKVAKPKGKIT